MGESHEIILSNRHKSETQARLLNGVFPVTATVLAMLLNFQGGFGLTYIAGVACYLLASLCLVAQRAIPSRP